MIRLFSSLCVLALAGSAKADVVYSTRYLGPGDVISRRPETRVYVSRDAILREDWSMSLNRHIRENTLTLLREQKTVAINLTLGIAREDAMPDLNKLTPVDLASQKVTELGEETVLGFKTHHYRLEGALRPTYHFRTEIWLAFAGDLKDWPLAAPKISPTDGPLVVLSKQSAAGLVVRTQRWASKSDTDPTIVPVDTEEVSSLMPIELEPAFYTVPATVKMMSAQEYSEATGKWRRARIEELQKEAAN